MSCNDVSPSTQIGAALRTSFNRSAVGGTIPGYIDNKVHTNERHYIKGNKVEIILTRPLTFSGLTLAFSWTLRYSLPRTTRTRSTTRTRGTSPSSRSTSRPTLSLNSRGKWRQNFYLINPPNFHAYLIQNKLIDFRFLGRRG